MKLQHAIGFLCEDMNVKITLKFRGREMAHTEFGFQVVQKFLADIAPYGHPDFEPKLIGRGIIVMITPLPRNKRAKAPQFAEGQTVSAPSQPRGEDNQPATPVPIQRSPRPQPEVVAPDGFINNPFAQLDISH